MSGHLRSLSLVAFFVPHDPHETEEINEIHETDQVDQRDETDAPAVASRTTVKRRPLHQIL